MTDDARDPLDASALDAPSTRDTNLAVGRTLLQLVPVVGGFFAELISNIPEERTRRQVEFMKSLATALHDVEDRLDTDYVRSDEFAGLVEDFVEATRSRREMEKREYYATALAHAATEDRPDTAELGRMVAILEDLRPAHLRLLAVIFETRHGEPEGAMSVDQVLQHALPEQPLDRVKMDWGDLANHNLVQAYPSGMMTPGSASDLSVRLTALGRRFHEFITRREAGS